jgi:hypothetical protein
VSSDRVVHQLADAIDRAPVIDGGPRLVKVREIPVRFEVNLLDRLLQRSTEAASWRNRVDAAMARPRLSTALSRTAGLRKIVDLTDAAAQPMSSLELLDAN